MAGRPGVAHDGNESTRSQIALNEATTANRAVLGIDSARRILDQRAQPVVGAPGRPRAGGAGRRHRVPGGSARWARSGGGRRSCECTLIARQAVRRRGHRLRRRPVPHWRRRGAPRRGPGRGGAGRGGAGQPRRRRSRRPAGSARRPRPRCAMRAAAGRGDRAQRGGGQRGGAGGRGARHAARGRAEPRDTTLMAPVSGLIDVANCGGGTDRAAGPGALAVVDLDDVWVMANYKETELTDVRPGQSATVTVDTYPGKSSARVDSIQAGRARCSRCCRPRTPTGNFVEVVQRVPVKLLFEPGENAQPCSCPACPSSRSSSCDEPPGSPGDRRRLHDDGDVPGDPRCHHRQRRAAAYARHACRRRRTRSPGC